MRSRFVRRLTRQLSEWKSSALRPSTLLFSRFDRVSINRHGSGANQSFLSRKAALIARIVIQIVLRLEGTANREALDVNRCTSKQLDNSDLKLFGAGVPRSDGFERITSSSEL